MSFVNEKITPRKKWTKKTSLGLSSLAVSSLIALNFMTPHSNLDKTPLKPIQENSKDKVYNTMIHENNQTTLNFYKKPLLVQLHGDSKKVIEAISKSSHQSIIYQAKFTFYTQINQGATPHDAIKKIIKDSQGKLKLEDYALNLNNRVLIISDNQ